jgi:hypothetical protein
MNARLPLLVLAAAVPLALLATTLPHTFTNGTVADATQVNANFETLATAIDAGAGASDVGDIVASMLDESTFDGRRAGTWVRADGRDVTGTAYASLVATTVPDLRGVFLRGANAGRSTSEGNPDGDTTVGTYQGSDNKSHGHSISWWASGGATLPNNFPGFANSYHPTPNQGASGGINPAGGSEARPRNVTVNYFIRVD